MPSFGLKKLHMFEEKPFHNIIFSKHNYFDDLRQEKLLNKLLTVKYKPYYIIQLIVVFTWDMLILACVVLRIYTFVE